MDIAGAGALVTGGASGVGAGAVRALHGAGATVFPARPPGATLRW